jgi:hypothetical protein
MKRYERVQQILEEGVNNQDIGFHGNFWRQATLEEFKQKIVFGKQLLVVGHPDESNLIKALKGLAPFGKDTGTSGAAYRRMPAGLPAIPQEKIDYISKWIEDGCPDEDDPPTDNSPPPPHPSTDAATLPDTSSVRDIQELMALPAQEHDLFWLQEALQNAIQLELSTIPPYLCALWSIKDASQPAYEVILSVVLEEMLHMGLACNMLNAIGGIPRINMPGVVPVYPGPLPGRVRPGLTVSLSRLTCDVLQNTFMQIEYPEGGPIVALDLGKDYATIGEFYDAVLDAFRLLPDGSISGGKQLTASFSNGEEVFAIKTLADVEKAIKEIKEQGEGTSQSPQSPAPQDNEPAHYYKFAEICKGNRLIKVAPNKWDYKGDPIPFPEVYPMATIPLGGYPEKSAEFDKLYTNLLDDLQAAWETPDQSRLDNAIYNSMFKLKVIAQALMQTPIDGGPSTYGPSFLLHR